MSRFDSFSFPVTTAASCSFDEGRVYWQTPDNYVVNLDDKENFEFLFGRAGHLSPPYSYISTRVPEEHGERLRRVHIDKRDIDVPIYIYADSYNSLTNKMRDLSIILDSASYEEESKLIFVDEDGDYRYINCVYSGGFGGNQAESNEFIVWAKIVLTFSAFDPFFYSPTEENIYFNFVATETNLIPYLPFNIAHASAIDDSVTINNDGFSTFPLWTLTGPFEQVTITNSSSGKSLVLDYEAAANEIVTIDTRLGQKKIESNINGNLYPTLTTLPSFWDIISGENIISMVISGISTTSDIKITYRPRYLTY